MVGIDVIEIASDAILIASQRSTDHILAGTPLLEVEADLFKISKGGDFPTDFHS